jgi:SAM-dependent methyltransferase
MSNNIETVAAAFDAEYAAGRCARYPNEFVVRFLAQDPRQKHPHAPPPDALDVGCGGGRHLKTLSEFDYRPTGIDCSSKALFMCRTWEEFYELHHGSATELPFPPCFFETVIAYASLYYGTHDDLTSAIADIHRVLVPRGRALIALRTSYDWRARAGLDEMGNRITFVAGPEFLFTEFSDVQIDIEEFTLRGQLNSNWIITLEK